MGNLKLLYGTTILFSLGFAGVGHAQTSDESESQSRVGLDEVIVTAERRETNLQSTPLSITAVGAEELEQMVVQGLDGLSAFVPNLNITYSAAYGRSNPQFNIRGVGSGVVSGGAVTERPVGLYIDGLYYARAQGSLLSVLDAESIEVLRGPQGTLFGRNSTGGAVSYWSKMPSNEFGGNIKAKIGNFGQKELQGTVNIPLGEKLALRATVATLERDGYVMRGDVDLGNVDDSVQRFQLRYTPSDNLIVDLGYSHSKTKTNGDARDITEFNLGASGAPGGAFGALNLLLVNQGAAPLVEDDPRIVLDGFTVANYCILDDPNPFTVGPECDTSLEADMNVMNARVVWDINDEFTLTSITGRIAGDQESNNDWVWTGAYRRPFSFDFESISQEFQLNYNTDRLKAVAGTVYFHENARESEVTTEVTRGSGSFILTEAEIIAGRSITRRDEDYQSIVDAYGIYAQATYSLTDKLDLTAGLRYSADKKEVNIRYNPTADDPRDETGGGDDSWDSLDWRAAAAYQMTDNFMIYASATKAYKAGIANDASIENRSNTENVIVFVPPEKALGYEAGIRSEWFDNRLRLNLTAYKTAYTDRQSARLVTDPTSGILVIETVSLGDVDFWGGEGEITLAVTDELLLTGSFGLSDYKQLDDPDAVLTQVPSESFTLGANYAFDLDSGDELVASLKYAWVAETYSRTGDADDFRQAVNDAYSLLNGRIEYTPEHGNWSVAVYGANLLDKNYSSSAITQTFHIGFGDRNVVGRYVGRPRSVGAELKVNF
ncbi:MAG: hypothetical protein COB36_13010 [Alphaproteobacteria bacterium]|nr:MAG: hypothetical protein COB36_13010 [Alphaproteobacteria bacterium]